MHSQAHAFLHPTCANIHQYQFNNPIVSSSSYDIDYASPSSYDIDYVSPSLYDIDYVSPSLYDIDYVYPSSSEIVSISLIV